MTGTQRPLDEVMLAMDVVDTLRHRERVVERELSVEEQDRQLVTRLREIYAGQGIEVSDAIIERGVRDLREDRFVYRSTGPSFGRSLAKLYVTRGRWGKPAAAVVGLAAAALVGYQVFIRGPELARIEALPERLEQAYSAVIELAEAPEVEAEALAMRGDGELAYDRRDYRAVNAAVGGLETLRIALASEYRVRVVSAPGEASGFWREPEDNPSAQNYYLVVEAVDANGNRLPMSITNEENGRTFTVRRWGQRVDAATFEAIRADKGDDGILQNAVVGEKRRGSLDPDYRPGVLSGAVTEW
jgi:hypothetical protein